MDNYVVDNGLIEDIKKVAAHEHKSYEEIFLRTVASNNKNITASDFIKIIEANKISSDNWYKIVVRLYYNNDDFNELCLNIYNLEISKDDYCGPFFEAVVEVVNNQMALTEENLDEVEYCVNPIFEQKFSEEKCLDDPVSMYINYVANFPLLTVQQERALFKKYNDGDLNAKKQIIEANQRLVFSRASKRVRKGLDLMDLVQEGNIGLNEAVEKYDYRFKFKFSTYAISWIDQKIRRAVESKANIIRIPLHAYYKTEAIKNAVNDYQNKYGHEPTDEELAEILKCDIVVIKDYRYCDKAIINLDQPIGEEEDSLLYNVIPDPNAPDPENEFITYELKKIFEDFFNNYSVFEDDNDTSKKLGKSTNRLTSREVDVIKKRCGFYDGTPKTLGDIGSEYNLTRERIRQIEAKALRKIKSYNSLKKKLEIYR